MRIIAFAMLFGVIFLSCYYDEGFAEQASGKSAWQYGSETADIVCGDVLCSDPSKTVIPNWIKNNALWWSEGRIDDSSFLSGIKFLIENKIIPIDAISKNTQAPFVPNWVKDTAGWWATGKIPDSDFKNALSWLVENRIIVITADELVIDVSGKQQVRRGVTHSIVVDVSRSGLPVEGAWVVITIEDYGEDVIREFDGYTDENGFLEFSWEVPKSFDDVETLLAFVGVSDDFSAKTVLFEFQVYCLPGEAGCKAEGN